MILPLLHAAPVATSVWPLIVAPVPRFSGTGAITVKMSVVNGAFQRAALWGLCLVMAGGVTVLAEQDGATTVEGRIFDAAGEPVADCRVVARIAEGTEVFISSRSDAEGRYSIVVPSGESYVIVALIAPTGARVTLPEPLQANLARVSRDLRIPLADTPGPRIGVNRLGGADRLFMSFVEDPALVGPQYWELQIGAAADNEAADLRVVRIVAAFTFRGLPRVEVGARSGYGEIRPSGADSESGALDLDLWGKLQLVRSANGRWDVAAGALMKLPTGDEDGGLGRDATQSELFVAASHRLKSVVLIGHVGIVTSEDGTVAGAFLDGEVTASTGLGVLVPLSSDASLVFEASYDGARFEQTDSESRVLAGLNWQVHPRGKVRAALAAGLADASADAELIAGYAVAF